MTILQGLKAAFSMLAAWIWVKQVWQTVSL